MNFVLELIQMQSQIFAGFLQKIFTFTNLFTYLFNGTFAFIL